ncbi:MAG: class II glutamine amidotransferase [Paracoccaceae bacterium]
MCRWAAYIGKPLYLSDILIAPEHSLIDQSSCANKGKARLNADGFGLAWYSQKKEPGVFKDILPAWSNINLASLADHIRSRLFLAHIRASTGTEVSRTNCHPFIVGRWSFIHNGLIGGFERQRKLADMAIPGPLYHHRKGTTDSEAFFLIALSLGLETDPHGAMLKTIQCFKDLTTDRSHMRLSIAMSDGYRLYAVRYSTELSAPSLFYKMHQSKDGYSVASEPYDTDFEAWNVVSNNSFCTFHAKDAPIIVPLIAQNYTAA